MSRLNVCPAVNCDSWYKSARLHGTMHCYGTLYRRSHEGWRFQPLLVFRATEVVVYSCQRQNQRFQSDGLDMVSGTGVLAIIQNGSLGHCRGNWTLISIHSSTFHAGWRHVALSVHPVSQDVGLCMHPGGKWGSNLTTEILCGFATGSWSKLKMFYSNKNYVNSQSFQGKLLLHLHSGLRPQPSPEALSQAPTLSPLDSRMLWYAEDSNTTIN